MKTIAYLIMLVCLVIYPIYIFAKKIRSSTHKIDKIKYSISIVFVIISLILFVYLNWKYNYFRSLYFS